MTREDWGGVQRLRAHEQDERADVSPADTTVRSVGVTRVLLEVEARSDKVKTSIDHQQRRCKEKKVYEPQILGALQKWGG